MKKLFVLMMLAIGISAYCDLTSELARLSEETANIRREIDSESITSYDDALKNGNYSRAAEILEGRINPNSILSEILAGEYVQLAMLKWNLREKSEAVDAMEKAINVMKYGRDVSGSGCEKRAEIFLKKMKRNELPRTFVCKDFYMSGVWGYIMAPVDAESKRRVARNTNYYRQQADYYDAAMASARHQAESNARIAKAYASSRYLKYTKDTFSPNNPPPRGSEKREYWDACKRVYDIFKN